MDNPAPPGGRTLPLGLLALAVAMAVGLGIRFGALRAAIAVLMFLAIAVFGSRQIRSMMSIPPEPDVADIGDFGLRYICTMCGLDLKIEKAARDKAPTHCMEPMVLVRGDEVIRPRAEGPEPATDS